MPTTKKIDKAIGLRFDRETHDKLVKVCEKLGNISINSFALESVKSCIDMIESNDPKLPKWVAVQRFNLNYKPEKLKK